MRAHSYRSLIPYDAERSVGVQGASFIYENRSGRYGYVFDSDNDAFDHHRAVGRNEFPWRSRNLLRCRAQNELPGRAHFGHCAHGLITATETRGHHAGRFLGRLDASRIRMRRVGMLMRSDHLSGMMRGALRM